MFRFMKRFDRDRQARRRGTGPLTRARRRNHRLDCETLESRQLLSGYYIVNEYSGKVLDDPGASPNNGAVIDQWQLNGGANQQWDLISVGNGYYQIRNEASGKVLDNSLSATEGTPIDQFQGDYEPNQYWQVPLTPDPSLGNGNYYCSGIVNAYSGMALDNSLSTSNGSVIDQWPQYFGPNQEWVLLAAGNLPTATFEISSVVNYAVLADGYPFVWDFAPLANGNDVIVSEATGKVLDGGGGGINPGERQLNGGQNQQWQTNSLGNASYTLLNASSNLVLDLTYGMDQFNGLASQEWYLSPAAGGVDIHGQPSNAAVGQTISPAITVAVVDAKGNTITANNTQVVTLAIASGPAGTKLLGTTTVRAVNGVADFSNLSLSLAGTYTLTATGGALTPDSSNEFTVAPANVTSAVTIRRGSMHKVGRASRRGSGGGLMAQTITIKNAGRQPLGGPLALRVGSLPSGVTLANATGTYEGGPYRDVLAALQPLAPGKSVTVTLDFSMSGRRSASLSKLDEDLEALLGI